jgi:hypothetical protein
VGIGQGVGEIKADGHAGEDVDDGVVIGMGFEVFEAFLAVFVKHVIHLLSGRSSGLGNLFRLCFYYIFKG